MPRLPPRPYHDEYHSAKEWVGQLPLAMVAQLIPSKEVRAISRKDKDGVVTTGWQAVKKEWDNLEARKCWDASQARPLDDVIREAKNNKELIHIGSMLEMCYLKHSELPEERQEFKGRGVVLGDRSVISTAWLLYSKPWRHHQPAWKHRASSTHMA